MDVIGQVTVRRRPERWYRRPISWMAVAGIALGLALFSLLGGRPTVAVVFLGVAGLCAAGSALSFIQHLRVARAEMVAIIDANLAERAAHPRRETEEDAAKRAALIAYRQRLSR